MHKPVLICYFSLLISILSLPVDSYSQNVGVGTNAPHAKAILEIKSTDKGVLFPRLTTAQRNVIVSPPDGLHIFNTDERCLNYYDSTTTPKCRVPGQGIVRSNPSRWIWR